MSEKSFRLNLESLGERVMPSASPVMASPVVTAPAQVSVQSPQVASNQVQPAYIEKWFLGQ
jgi:hypothetical protein